MGDDYITDATDLWCFFMEQSKLTKNSESLATTKQVTDAYVNREQLFYEDTEILSTPALQPFVTQCYVTNLRKSFSAEEMFGEACLYILKAGYTPFLNTFDDASKAHIVLRSSNKQLLITNQLTLLFRKSELESLINTSASLLLSLSGTNSGDTSSRSELQQKNRREIN